MADPFALNDEGPTVSVTLKAGPSYNEDVVNFRGSPDDLAEIFGITEDDWKAASADGKKASTLLQRVKLLGDYHRAQHGGPGKA